MSRHTDIEFDFKKTLSHTYIHTCNIYIYIYSIHTEVFKKSEKMADMHNIQTTKNEGIKYLYCIGKFHEQNSEQIYNFVVRCDFSTEIVMQSEVFNNLLSICGCQNVLMQPTCHKCSSP